jgi:hypothetical protein
MQLGYAARRSLGLAVNPRGLGGAYQGALEATLAIVISVLFGVWLDTKLETSPAFLFTGMAVGFGAFILRLTRLLKEVGEQDGGKGGTPRESVPPAETTGIEQGFKQGIEESGPEGPKPRTERQAKPRAEGGDDRQRDQDQDL